MANNTQDEILKRFEQAAWTAASSGAHATTATTSGAGQRGAATAVVLRNGSETTESNSSAERSPVAGRRLEGTLSAESTRLQQQTDAETGLRAEAISASGTTEAAGEQLGNPGDWISTAAEPAGQNVQGGVQTEQPGGGGSSTAETVLKDVFEGGLGLVPLIGGLAGLFGGGSNNPPPLLKYEMPSSISFMSADSGDQLAAADYNELGLPRVYGAAYTGAAPASGSGVSGPPVSPADLSTGAARGDVSGVNGVTGGANGAAAAPQITVNVQALDAQSFLDRSNDIAQAVRSAMLSMNSINDVVSDL